MTHQASKKFLTTSRTSSNKNNTEFPLQPDSHPCGDANRNNPRSCYEMAWTAQGCLNRPHSSTIATRRVRAIEIFAIPTAVEKKKFGFDYHCDRQPEAHHTDFSISHSTQGYRSTESAARGVHWKFLRPTEHILRFHQQYSEGSSYSDEKIPRTPVTPGHTQRSRPDQQGGKAPSILFLRRNVEWRNQ